MADPSQVPILIEDLNKAATSDDSSQLLPIAKALVAALEEPEITVNYFVLSPCAHASLASLSQLGVLTPFEGTKTANDLGLEYNADPTLVARLMRAVVTYGIFLETGEETYSHNKTSILLSTPPHRQQFASQLATLSSSINKLPEYLASIEWRNPGDRETDPTLWQFVQNTDEPFYQWIQKQPAKLAAFNAFQARSIDLARTANPKLGFAGIYPFENESADLKPGEIAMVDVGGGHGQVIEDVLTAIPALKGHVVLEDLAETVQGCKHIEGMKVVPYDFFQEQPIKGARLYIFRHIFHNWPDHACRAILRNTTSALSGVSRILIVENVLSNNKPTVFGALYDINMIRFNGRERTEHQWVDLLESVGLRVAKIWPPTRRDSVIEAYLP